jgi:UDP-N-acetyl-D-glucosamine/UDP-N-acetyl-D-galactosamine dehydrogenase
MARQTMQPRKVAIVGLGYVGLPIAVAFGKRQPVIGFDVNRAKIEALQNGVDRTGQVSVADLKASRVQYTSEPTDLKAADFIIVAVPTPINEALRPDLTALRAASELIGKHLALGSIVVYESTVYPGATEEECLPILEKASGLKCGVDFKLGYSPERMNPGDKEHTLEKIVKVVSAQDEESLEVVADTYALVVEAGIHRAPSIKVAEAAKVIENTQRDLNIALMNELAIIFDKLNIDTTEVLEAAGTKWNFLKFKPGLVGGHCIGVDPYYLTHKADMLGYHPQVILAGRRINDGMGKFIAEQTVKQMIAAGSYVKGAKVNILGLTFKENCADLRNSKVVDIIHELQSYSIEVFVHEPEATADEAMREYGVKLYSWDELPRADAIVAAVAHRRFLDLDIEDLSKKIIKGGAFVDVKAQFDAARLRSAGLSVWRL